MEARNVCISLYALSNFFVEVGSFTGKTDANVDSGHRNRELLLYIFDTKVSTSESERICITFAMCFKPFL